MKLGLRVEVNTLRGLRNGVPRLLEALARQGARATFFFNLGPDRSGRAVLHGLSREWLPRPAHESALSHYGVAALWRGLLLPSADLGEVCHPVMRSAQEAGHEVAIQAWDRSAWLGAVESADNDWTEAEFGRAVARFQAVFGRAPLAHGAAGWRINRHGLRLTQRLGFTYSSDTRGHCPFIPLWEAEIVACPQIPTTLPTLDELVGKDGASPDQSTERLLELSGQGELHVLTVRAELEGGRLLPQFETLLAGWRSRGETVAPLHELADELDLAVLPRHAVSLEPRANGRGRVLVQGPEFLA